MFFKRLIFAVYFIVAICAWWLIEQGDSVWSWLLFLPILGAAFSLDYFIGRWRQRVRQRYQ
jgi:hypothetical protein